MKDIVLIIILLCFLTSCKSVVDKYAFYPDQKTIILEKDLPAYIHLVTFSTTDKLLLQGLYFQHETNKLNTKLLIYFHGNGGNMYHRIKESTQLYDLGINVLVVSYRGYAKSEGKPSELGIYKDGKAALQYAIKSLGYLEENIIIFGRSIGTAVAVDLAQNRNIDSLILITPFSSAFDLANAADLGIVASIVGTSYNSSAKINNILCPLLIIHGSDDEVIPFNLGKKLYSSYQGEKIFVEITNGKHNDLEYVDPVLYYKSINDFIKSK